VSSKSAAALTAVGALAAVETRVLDPSGIKFLPTNVAGCKVRTAARAPATRRAPGARAQVEGAAGVPGRRDARRHA
jgi:hypothetical protein